MSDPQYRMRLRQISKRCWHVHVYRRGPLRSADDYAWTRDRAIAKGHRLVERLKREEAYAATEEVIDAV